jgi:agmatinase
VTIDIDGFDPSIALGKADRAAASPITRRGAREDIVGSGCIVGVDLVEVASDCEYAGATAILAAQILLNLPGRSA